MILAFAILSAKFQHYHTNIDNVMLNITITLIRMITKVIIVPGCSGSDRANQSGVGLLWLGP